MANDQEYVSMLDLKADTEEIMGYNPEADANAFIPPFPAGTYPCKVRYAEEDPEKIWAAGVAKDGQKFYKTAVVLELYGTPEGLHDGRTVTHYINTYTSKFGGTNSVQALLQGLGKGPEIIAIKSRGGLVQALNDALMGGGGAAEGEFEWHARYAVEEPPESGMYVNKYEKFGMAKFDKNEDGTYNPVANYKGIDVPARNVLKRFVNPAKSAGASANVHAGMTAPPQQAVAQGQRPAGAISRSSAPQPTSQATQAPNEPPMSTGGTPGSAVPNGPPIPARARQGAPHAVPVGGAVPAGTKR